MQFIPQRLPQTQNRAISDTFFSQLFLFIDNRRKIKSRKTRFVGRPPLSRLRRRFGPLRGTPSAAARRFAPHRGAAQQSGEKKPLYFLTPHNRSCRPCCSQLVFENGALGFVTKLIYKHYPHKPICPCNSLVATRCNHGKKRTPQQKKLLATWIVRAWLDARNRSLVYSNAQHTPV